MILIINLFHHSAIGIGRSVEEIKMKSIEILMFLTFLNLSLVKCLSVETQEPLDNLEPEQNLSLVENIQDYWSCSSPWRKAAIIVGAAIAVPLVVQGGIAAAGFGAAGVGPGTLAAGIQSTIGNVAAGSLFASKNL